MPGSGANNKVKVLIFDFEKNTVLLGNKSQWLDRIVSNNVSSGKLCGSDYKSPMNSERRDEISWGRRFFN